MRYARACRRSATASTPTCSRTAAGAGATPGLVVDGERTLLIDTLFDLRLTEEMLREMRRAVPAAARIDTLVNTHANGDHCYGNQLVGDARDRRLGAHRRGDDRAAAGGDGRARRAGAADGRARASSSCAASARSTSTGIELVLPQRDASAASSTLRVGDARGAPDRGRPGAHARRHARACSRPSACCSPATSSSTARTRSPGPARSRTGSPRASASSRWTLEVIVPGHGPLARRPAPCAS